MVFVNNEKVLKGISLPTHLLAPPTTSQKTTDQFLEEIQKRKDMELMTIRFDNIRERLKNIQRKLSSLGESFSLHYPAVPHQLDLIKYLMGKVEDRYAHEDLSSLVIWARQLDSAFSSMEKTILAFEGQLLPSTRESNDNSVVDSLAVSLNSQHYLSTSL